MSIIFSYFLGNFLKTMIGYRDKLEDYCGINRLNEVRIRN